MQDVQLIKRTIYKHHFFHTSFPTICAVIKAPATTQAFIISVVFQFDSTGRCIYQTWALFTTQLHGLSAWNGQLQVEEEKKVYLYTLCIPIVQFVVRKHFVYLQPVKWTPRTLLSVHSCYVEIVTEV